MTKHFAMGFLGALVGVSVALISREAIDTAQAQQAAPSGATTQAKIDVAKALQNYMKVFNERNFKAVAEDIWTNPSIGFSNAGITVIDLAAQLKRSEDVYKTLDQVGWDRTDTPSSTVCILNENAALISGDYRRLRKDGSVIEQRGSVNLFSKGPDGWKMVARIITAPGKTAACSD